MKNIHKRLLLTGFSLSLLLLLSGCVRTDEHHKPVGTIWNLLGKPMSSLITYFADHLGLGLGMGIILVTVIVRLIILPLSLKQSSGAAYQTAKREHLAPIFEPINKRIKEAQTREEKMAANAELLEANRANGISLLGGVGGCLPLLIQFPFFSALYYATRYTPGVSEENFLWFNLGHRDLLLMAIITSLYLFQSWLAVRQMPQEQREQAGATMYMTPIMMLIFGFASTSAVVLYWLVGGVFSIFQQLLTIFFIKPHMKKKVAEEFKNNPPKMPQASQKTRKDVTPKQSAQAITNQNKKRNAGKQNRHK